MKVTKFGRVDIYVKDMDKAIEFFTKFLGVKFPEPRTLEQDDAKITATYPLGIGLLAPLIPDGPTAKYIERRGEGALLIQLRVPNVEEAMAEANSMGVRRIGKTPRLHPKDTYGVIFELLPEETNQST